VTAAGTSSKRASAPRFARACLLLAAGVLPGAVQPASTDVARWVPVRGEAVQIVLASDGAAFVLDRQGRPWRRRPGESSVWSSLPGQFAKIDVGLTGQPWALDGEGRIFRFTGSFWEQLAGFARDLGVGPEGTVYVLDAAGGVARYEAKLRAFAQLPEAPPPASAIDVDELGLPWVVLADGRALRFDGVAWQPREAPVPLRALAIGPDGTVFAVATDGSLHRFDAKARAWVGEPSPAPAASVGVNPRGKPWIATTAGKIFASETDVPPVAASRKPAPVFTRLLPWTRVRGAGREIAIGTGGEVFSLGLAGEVWQWKGRETWSMLPGRLERIAVAADGLPWGIDRSGRILQFRGASWSEVPGAAREIAIGSSGAKWVILTDGTPARWEPKARTWIALPGVSASRIAVDARDRPWIIVEGEVRRHDGSTWQPLPGVKAQDIAIGPEGTVYAAGTDNRPYRFEAKQGEWIAVNGEASRVAVGPRGMPWAVTPGSQIFAAARFEEEAERKAAQAFEAATAPRPSSRQVPAGSSVVATSRADLFFQKVPGNARAVAIGNDGSVFAIDFNGKIVRWNNGRSSFLPFTGLGQRIAVQRDGNPWVVTSAGEVFRFDGADWRVVRDILAFDIGIGGAAENRDDVIVAGTDLFLYRYDAAADRFARIQAPGTAPPPFGRQVAVDGHGRPWTITDQGQVQRCDQNPCVLVPQGARDIAIGPEDSVFIIDLDRNLRRFDRRTGRFERVDSPVSVLDAVGVGPGGVPWIVKSNSDVYAAGFFKRDESRDLQTAQTTALASTSTQSASVFTFSLNMRFDVIPMPEFAISIAISAKGVVRAVASFPTGTLYIYDEKKKAFVVDTNLSIAPPGISRIAIEADGTLWAVDQATATLRRREKNSYVSFPGLTGVGAPFFSVGGDGSVLATSPDRTLFRFDPAGRRWVKTPYQFPGDDTEISVDQNGRPWITDVGFNIYEYTGVGFEKRPGLARQVSAGATGAVYICDDALVLKRWSPTLRNWEPVLNTVCISVAVGPDGRPWIINDSGEVLRAR